MGTLQTVPGGGPRDCLGPRLPGATFIRSDRFIGKMTDKRIGILSDRRYTNPRLS